MKNYKVYFLKDTNGKIVYCGLTRSKLHTRFICHVSRKHLDSNKYTIQLVSDNLSLDEAALLERTFIKLYDLIKNGFNKSPGSINGYSNEHSAEQKAKWSIERKGIKVSPEHAEKNRVARLGKHNSEEHNRKISEGNSKPIVCIETGIIYKNARIASRELQVPFSDISMVCNGVKNHTHKLHFKFFNETVETDRNIPSYNVSY